MENEEDFVEDLEIFEMKLQKWRKLGAITREIREKRRGN